ncbi:MarR family winged helix-turn-helix transcriptional regulator [Lutibacter holmesii]|uniref:MarR family winged helix-turn-helix transcriptional regulator n=1 Tax=Lutibacter holmesii TaxID=1137985 RepID=A0ABW3WQH0_9FLAO
MLLDLEKSDFNKTLAPWIGRTSKMLNGYISDVLNSNNISITKQQWIILKILNENPEGIIQNKLAFITERNKASLTRLINGMEKKNLVARIQSKLDSRKNIVYSTEKGTELFLKTKPLMLNSIQKIQEGITDDEMTSFRNIINKIQQNLTNQSK